MPFDALCLILGQLVVFAVLVTLLFLLGMWTAALVKAAYTRSEFFRLTRAALALRHYRGQQRARTLDRLFVYAESKSANPDRVVERAVNEYLDRKDAEAKTPN